VFCGVVAKSGRIVPQKTKSVRVADETANAALPVQPVPPPKMQRFTFI
jgi:hypothetical protein